MGTAGEDGNESRKADEIKKVKTMSLKQESRPTQCTAKQVDQNFNIGRDKNHYCTSIKSSSRLHGKFSRKGNLQLKLNPAWVGSYKSMDKVRFHSRTSRLLASSPELSRPKEEISSLISEKLKQLSMKETDVKYDLMISMLDHRNSQEYIRKDEENEWLQLFLKHLQSDLNLEKNTIQLLLQRTLVTKDQCDWEDRILSKEVEETERNVRQYEDYICNDCYTNFVNATWDYLKNTGHDELKCRKQALLQQKLELKERSIACWEKIKACQQMLSYLNQEEICRKQRRAEFSANLAFNEYFRRTFYQTLRQRLLGEKKEIQMKKCALQNEMRIGSNAQSEQTRNCVLETQRLGCTFDFMLEHRVHRGGSTYAYNNLVDVFRKKPISLEIPDSVLFDTIQMLVSVLENCESRLNQEETMYLKLEKIAEEKRRQSLLLSSSSLNRHDDTSDSFSDFSMHGERMTTFSPYNSVNLSATRSSNTQERMNVSVKRETSSSEGLNILVSNEIEEEIDKKSPKLEQHRTEGKELGRNTNVPDIHEENSGCRDRNDVSSNLNSIHTFNAVTESKQEVNTDMDALLEYYTELEKLISAHQLPLNVSELEDKSKFLDCSDLKDQQTVTDLPSSSSVDIHSETQRSVADHKAEEPTNTELIVKKPCTFLRVVKDKDTRLSTTTGTQDCNTVTAISESNVQEKHETDAALSQIEINGIGSLLQADGKQPELTPGKFVNEEHSIQNTHNQTVFESGSTRNFMYMEKRDVLLTKLQQKMDMLSMQVQNSQSELSEIRRVSKTMQSGLDRILNILEKNSSCNEQSDKKREKVLKMGEGDFVPKEESKKYGIYFLENVGENSRDTKSEGYTSDAVESSQNSASFMRLDHRFVLSILENLVKQTYQYKDYKTKCFVRYLEWMIKTKEKVTPRMIMTVFDDKYALDLPALHDLYSQYDKREGDILSKFICEVRAGLRKEWDIESDEPDSEDCSPSASDTDRSEAYASGILPVR